MNQHCPPAIDDKRRRRIRLDVTGAVQGVGFRPFVYRLARAEGLAGFVQNTGDGARIEVEGASPAIEHFLGRFEIEIAPPAEIHGRRSTRLPASGANEFVIAPSAGAATPSALVLPDLATCPDCLREILDPADRRYRYPFTTCVRCGPRYSIIEALPYDRSRTVMRRFRMCPACQAEYDDPESRRFHAETNACPNCGPKLSFWDQEGRMLASREAALTQAAVALRQGMIVALKGLGGFQLLADAANEETIRRLRAGKRRPRKPLALMVPSLGEAELLARLSPQERDLLTSMEAPIVVLAARGTLSRPSAPSIAANVAPDNPTLGIMLPYTPLHHLLLRALGVPVVATSGNLGDEPILSDENAALPRLSGIADCFLVHDREIVRPVDDSLARVMAGQSVVLRRARGYALRPVALKSASPPVLALGGHQKNAIATAFGGEILAGPHLGDLEAPATRIAFDAGVERLTAFHALRPEIVACDAHPDYHTTRYAAQLGVPVLRVPHHLAHVLSGMVDNGLEAPVLGIAWDGTGYGADGTIWGGECLALYDGYFRRAAHLAPFRLPGGEAAVREPRRAALGALHALFGAEGLNQGALPPTAAFTAAERHLFAVMLGRGVSAPLTSSAGRLFDAASSLLGLCQMASFEGEAAMAVEFAAGRAGEIASLPALTLRQEGKTLVLDWRPMMKELVAAIKDEAAPEPLAAGLHETLAAGIVAVAERVGIAQVLLTGGCFQNARLTERAVDLLRRAGFTPYWHRGIPPNDGGLAVGQAAYAYRPLVAEKS